MGLKITNDGAPRHNPNCCSSHSRTGENLRYHNNYPKE
jgi:hypothetical protein